MKTFDPKKDLIIVLDGGLVSAVCTNNQEIRDLLKNAVVIDYGVDYEDPREFTYIKQNVGKQPSVLASVTRLGVGTSGIDDDEDLNDVKKLIEAHRYLYYVLRTPVLTDREFDALLSKVPEIDGTGGLRLESDYSEEVRELALAMRRGEK